MNVDLPEPDGPVTARNSPRSTSRLTPRKARTSTSPTTYGLTRFLTEMTLGIELTGPVRRRRRNRRRGSRNYHHGYRRPAGTDYRQLPLQIVPMTGAPCR